MKIIRCISFLAIYVYPKPWNQAHFFYLIGFFVLVFRVCVPSRVTRAEGDVYAFYGFMVRFSISLSHITNGSVVRARLQAARITFFFLTASHLNESHKEHFV